MSSTQTITAYAVQGDTLHSVVVRHIGSTKGGVIEATLAANPGLAALGPVLPVGTRIDITRPVVPLEKSVKLWD
jgi:phage tail protein X